MSKSTFFTGQPILSQLLDYIPYQVVERADKQTRANRYCKSFFSRDHLVTMLYAGFFQVTSLRELITGLQANQNRLAHLGLHNTPRRSTLSDANNRRDAAFFEQVYHGLYRHFFPDSPAKNPLLIIDSTTITLFSDVMRGAGSFNSAGKKKGGVKVHALVNAEHDLPAFVRITEGCRSDVAQLRSISLPKGSVIVMDKGYIDYEQYRGWGDEITWITRCRENAMYEVLGDNALNDTSIIADVLKDQNVLLGHRKWEKKSPPINARLITFYDKKNDRIFKFITNDKSNTPEQIASYYKQRWQIELLFKRIKQRYPLRYFLGDSPNAIKIQIWCALICDLLVTIIKRQLEQQNSIRWSYANLSGMIKHHLMTYLHLINFLKNPEKALLHYRPPNPQIQLWGLT